MDIASLGFEIDSSGAKTASTDLSKMATAAKAAEGATVSMGNNAAASLDRVGAAADRAKAKQQSAAQQVLNDLNFEKKSLSMTSAERTVANNLRRAGVEASSAEGAAITASSAALRAETELLERRRGTITKVAGALSGLGGPAASAGGAMQSFAAGLTSAELAAGPAIIAVGALVAIFSGVVATLALFVHNTIEADEVTAQIAATLNATKEAAGQTAESIADLGTKYQSLTVFGDEAVKGAANVLLMFTRIRGEAFEPALKVTLDMAQAMGTDLKSAAMTVGKAMDNPLRGMLLLKRAGADLAPTQKETIKNFIAQGNVVAAQGVILDAFNKRFEGSAEAARDTLGGALKSLKNAFGDLFELGGDTTNPLQAAIESLITQITDPAFKVFIDLIGAVLFTAVGVTVRALTAVVFVTNLIVKIFQVAWQATKQLADDGFGYLTKVIQDAFGVDLATSIKSGTNALISGMVVAYNEIKFLFSNLPTVIGSAFILMINEIRAAMNGLVNSVLTTPLNTVNEWLNKNVRPEGKSKPGFEPMAPLAPIANPFADELNKGGQGRGGSAMSPREIQDADNAIVRATDHVAALGAAFAGAEPKAKKVGKTGAGAMDEIDQGADKAGEKYAKIVLGAEQFIQKQKLEGEALGQTALQAATLKYQQDLLNKAQTEGITLSGTQRDKLVALGTSMGEAEIKMKTLTNVFNATKEGEQFIAQQELAMKQIGLSAEAAARLRYEYDLINKASENGKLTLGDDQIAGLKATAAQMAATEAAVKSYSDSVAFAKDIMGDFFSDMKDAIYQGKNLWTSFGDAVMGILTKVANKLLNMAIDGLFNAAFSTGSSAIGSSTTPNASGQGGGFSLNGIMDIGKSIYGMFGGGTGVSAAAAPLGGYSATLGADGLGTTSSFLGGGASGGATTGGLTGSLGGAGSALGMAGGALGIGMGAMSLMNAKSTTGKIAGGAQMVGGALMMIPTGYTQIAGAIIMAASAILPGLLGDSNPVITNQEYGDLTYSGGKWGTSGGAWGPDANSNNLTGPLGALGSSIDALIKVAGGGKNTESPFGLATQSMSRVQGDSSFSNKTVFVIGENGERKQWGQSSDPAEQSKALDTAAAHITHQMLLQAGSGVSDMMRSALSNYGLDNLDHAFNLQELSDFVAGVNTLESEFKQFGKTTNEAQKAIDSVNATFDDMTARAVKFDLAQADIAKIDVERKRQQMLLTKDFADGISSAMLAMTNPLQAALNDNQKAWDADIATNQTFLDNVVGFNSQRLQIDALYNMKAQQIRDDANAQALADQKTAADAMAAAMKKTFDVMTDLIARLIPGGDLAGVGNDAMQAGLKATYDAARSQVFASPMDENAVARFSDAATKLLEFEKSFYGSDDRYIAERDQVIADAQKTQSLIAPGATLAPSGTAANSNTDLATALSVVSMLSQKIDAQSNQIANLMAIVARTVGNGRS